MRLLVQGGGGKGDLHNQASGLQGAPDAKSDVDHQRLHPRAQLHRLPWAAETTQALQQVGFKTCTCRAREERGRDFNDPVSTQWRVRSLS